MFVKILLSICILFFNIVCYANYAVVDFSKPSYVKRFFIYNNQGKLLYSTWVAHGIGSGSGATATVFSNRDGSLASSLGRYKIGEMYYGKHGRSYRLYGLDKTNSNVYKRDIVIHSASYIGHGQTGHSWGCLAVPTDAISTVLKLLKPGDILTAHS